jgi:NAD(P)-dependent dehydrogenase (short-subunit alcohol dehydrogenase family)
MSGHLPSYGSDLRVAVIGAGGGLGGAFVQTLAADPKVARLHALSRRRPDALPGAALWQQIELTDEDSVARAAERVAEESPALQLVIVATGILHDEARGLAPEKTWRHLTADALLTAYSVNAVGPALAAKHFLPLLDRERRSAFAALSARVGSIEDNRFGGWHAYRASKAALNQLLRTLSIELARRNPQAFCVGLHPGTVDTGLSKPFQGNVPGGKLFTPAYSAARLLEVLDGLSEGDSGALFAWDGARIPY